MVGSRWIYGMAIWIITEGLLMTFLPESGNQKGIRFFFGLITLTLLCHPLVSLLKGEGELLLWEGSQRSEGSQRESQLSRWGEEVIAKREDLWGEALKSLANSFDLELCQVEMDWEQDNGELTGMRMRVRECMDDSGSMEWEESFLESIEPIEPIRISEEGEGDKEEEESLSPMEEERREKKRQDWIKAMGEIFSLPEEKISVVWENGQ